MIYYIDLFQTKVSGNVILDSPRPGKMPSCFPSLAETLWPSSTPSSLQAWSCLLMTNGFGCTRRRCPRRLALHTFGGARHAGILSMSAVMSMGTENTLSVRQKLSSTQLLRSGHSKKQNTKKQNKGKQNVGEYVFCATKIPSYTCSNVGGAENFSIV